MSATSTSSRRRAARLVELTATELELLRVLSLNAGRVVTCETLLRQVRAGRNSADSKDKAPDKD